MGEMSEPARTTSEKPPGSSNYPNETDPLSNNSSNRLLNYGQPHAQSTNHNEPEAAQTNNRLLDGPTMQAARIHSDAMAYQNVPLMPDALPLSSQLQMYRQHQMGSASACGGYGVSSDQKSKSTTVLSAFS